MSAKDLAHVLGRVPSGLFVLSARQGDDEIGMLASWVMQAGFDPPMLTVALSKERQLAAWLAEGAPFVVAVLADDQQSIVRQFGRGSNGHSIFEGVETRTMEDVPTPSGAVGYLRCEPVSHVDSEDHRIFLAKIVDGQLDDGINPMVHVRKSGLKY